MQRTMRTSSLQTATTSTAPAVLVQPSPNRTALLFLAPVSTATVTVNTRPPAAEGDGILLQSGAGAVQLTRELHGDIVGQAWFARASGAAVLATWVESMGGA